MSSTRENAAQQADNEHAQQVSETWWELPLPAAFDEARKAIDEIRRKEGQLKSFEVRREVLSIILENIRRRGTFYSQPTGTYFFWNQEGRLVPLTATNIDFCRLLRKFGIEPGDRLVSTLAQSLALWAVEKGVRTELFRFAHYDARNNRLHVAFGDVVYCITASSIDEVRNGDRGIVFLPAPLSQGFKMGPRPSARDGTALDAILDTIRFVNGALSPDEQRQLLKTWIYSLFFNELSRTKPILTLVGDAGSGKTTALRMIGQLAFGPSFDVTPLSGDPKDFDAAVTNERFVAFDNADSPQSWLEDRLAIAATGGKIKRRSLYSDNTLVEFPVTASLGITSRTPYFRREDVADRALPLYLERRSEFRPETALLDELSRARSAVLTAIVYDLQAILKELGQERAPSKHTLRMADFAYFATICDAAFGNTADTRVLLERLKGVQDDFAAEGEPILQLLDEWVSKHAGKEVKAAQLHTALLAIAGQAKVAYTCKNPAALGRRLTQVSNTLRNRYQMTVRQGAAHARFYTFDLRDMAEAA